MKKICFEKIFLMQSALFKWCKKFVMTVSTKKLIFKKKQNVSKPT